MPYHGTARAASFSSVNERAASEGIVTELRGRRPSKLKRKGSFGNVRICFSTDTVFATNDKEF